MAFVLFLFRSFLGLALFGVCALLSLRGVPLALVSMLGSAIVLVACQIGTSVIAHPNSCSNPESLVGRAVLVMVAFLIASFGLNLINWGGLISIDMGAISIHLGKSGALMGIAGGLLNIDEKKLPSWI